ncbi:MAG TPA: TIGR02117 family protein [Crocinitomicaceae bacterium]|nr:TIGR02117 family protein [Crocinitomicaceae bacterium]
MITVGELKKDGELYIYVQSNGVHTDVCLPVENTDFNWTEFLEVSDYREVGDTSFISIGWGDKGFFLDTPTWAELKISTALNAALLPSSTAMHVAYSSEPIITKSRKKVFLNSKEYAKPIDFAKSSFQLKNDEADLIIGKGYSDSDNFYEANNSYHLFRTCNSWTNDALKAANIKTGIWALFPEGIMAHL